MESSMQIWSGWGWGGLTFRGLWGQVRPPRGWGWAEMQVGELNGVAAPWQEKTGTVTPGTQSHCEQ